MVVFYTMAYNAERSLPRTIQSVLNQTEQNWIWYLLDNAAEDATGEIIHQYAAKDSRIIPLKNEKNWVFTNETSYNEIAKRHADTDWFCFLDADDEYDPRFLTEMLAFARDNRLDVAACGSDFVESGTGVISSQRVLPYDLIIANSKDFGKYFKLYYRFLRTNWAKLFSIKTVKQTDVAKLPNVFYGADTLHTQEILRNANRFGILAKSLHRYYVAPKSLSSQWDSFRLETDRILYRIMCSFLVDKCGTISELNRLFLYEVYCAAITDTIAAIGGANLPPEEMLCEYRKIAVYPLTLIAYRESKREKVMESKEKLIQTVLQVGTVLKESSDNYFQTIVQTLLPHCGQAAFLSNAQMFLEDPILLHALFQDDSDKLMQNLLSRMERKQDVKKYAIPEAIQALAVNNPLLCQISDVDFLQKYSPIYLTVWRGETLPALDGMTGLLIEGQVTDGKETFLQLYISLAALEDQAPAFIFGKLRLAWFLLEQGRKEECCAIADELMELGVETEELISLRQKLC